MFTRLASTRLRAVAAAAALTVAVFATAADLNGSHPDSYTVRKGDTLWDISAKFLKKPWLWPEIWQANPQIGNPHLIYPGDVISLAYLNRVAVQPGPREEAPVNAVNLSDVEPFLKDLSIADQYENLPYVVALEENRLRASGGQKAYVLGLSGAAVGQRYAVIRPTLRYTQTRLASNGRYLSYNEDLDYRGRRLKGDTIDWDRQWTSSALAEGPMELLGYEMKRVNAGTVTRLPSGDVDTTTLDLDENMFEVRAGDRVVPVSANAYDLQFFPHAPKVPQPAGKLQVAAVADGMLFGGTHDVIAISGGSREGIDNGTVFSIWRPGKYANDRVRHPESSRMDDSPRDGAGRVGLPDEYASHAMVFRTFEKVSYALVMDGSRPTRIGYTLKHPDATE